MASGGVRVEETITCAFTGSGAAFDRVFGAVSADGSYRVVEVAPGRLRFVRRFRPTWATCVGVLTLPLALVGVLFLRVRTTETCSVVVEADHHGTRVRLDGMLCSAILGRIRMELADVDVGRALRPTVADGVGGPVASVYDLRDAPALVVGAGSGSMIDRVSDSNGQVSLEVAPAQVVPLLPPAVVTPPPSAVPLLVLDDGRRVELGQHNLLGRDPVANADDGSVALVVIDDPAGSVSKTHLSVVHRDGAWLVTDRYSTNGSAVIGPDGAERAIPPGGSIEAPAGATVRFGARTFRIGAGGA